MQKKLVPDYIERLVTYQAGKPIDELAREKNLTRISKIASNENPLGPSPMAIREMTNVLWDVHRYPDMSAYQLKKALGVHGSACHNVAIIDEQCRNDHFILGVDTEKILEAAFTGVNTKSRDIMVVRGKGANAFMAA